MPLNTGILSHEPIQVSADTRGLDHDASHELARLVRELAIFLFNEHGKLDFSQQLTRSLQSVFAEVGELAELATEDVSTLERIDVQRQLTSIEELCASAVHDAQEDPASARKIAEQIVASVPPLLSKLPASSVPTDVMSEVKDHVAITLTACAVEFGKETGKWNHSVSILTGALDYAVSQDLRNRIQDCLDAGKRQELAAALTSTPQVVESRSGAFCRRRHRWHCHARFPGHGLPFRLQR